MRLRSVLVAFALAGVAASAATLAPRASSGPRAAAAPAAAAPSSSASLRGGSYTYALPSRDDAAQAVEDRLARVRALLAGVGEDADPKVRASLEQQAQAELLQLLAEHPEAAALVEAALLDEGYDTAFSRIALGALAGCGRPEAQAALLHLAEARGEDRDFLRQVVTVMGFAKDPSPALVDGLRRLGAEATDTDVRGMAVLALGGAARRLPAASSAALVDELRGGLEASVRAGDANARGSYLGALGNVGSPQAVAAILPYAKDGDAMVRARAMTALRQGEGDEVDATLTGAVTNDAAPNVRRAAAWSLSRRPPTPATVAALAAALPGETDSDAALAMLDALLRARRVHPALVEAALAAAAHHPVREVRKAIARLAS